MKIWEGEFDKLLHEIEDQFSRRWHPKSVRTLVERVDNDVDRVVIGIYECLLQVLHQHVISGLVSTVVVSQIYVVEYIATDIEASGELGKERKQQVSAILFIGVLKVEVKVSHGGQSGVA